MNDYFLDLFDQFYRENVTQKILSWVEDQEDESPKTLELQAKTIRRLIIDPLNLWLSEQKKNITEVKKAISFVMAVEEIEYGLLNQDAKKIDATNMGKAWADFVLSFAYNHALTVHLQSENQRKRAQAERGGGIIHRLVRRIARINPEGTAKELWPELFSTLEDEFENVYEQQENRFIPSTWTYFYTDPKSNDKHLKFKTFQNILPLVRKNIS